MSYPNIAVFIDRDGTINKEVHYLNKVEDFCLYPKTIEAIKRINSVGLKTVIITNQSAIARGYLSEQVLNEIHTHFKNLLAKEGAHVDGIYYCPHHPDNGCDCRKPAPKMLLDAQKDLNIDLKKSFMIGDKISDIKLGHTLGLTTIMVLTGYGEKEQSLLEKENIKANFIAQDLYSAIEWIIAKHDF